MRKREDFERKVLLGLDFDFRRKMKRALRPREREREMEERKFFYKFENTKVAFYLNYCDYQNFSRQLRLIEFCLLVDWTWTFSRICKRFDRQTSLCHHMVLFSWYPWVLNGIQRFDNQILYGTRHIYLHFSYIYFI